jgi:hypothetical protein
MTRFSACTDKFACRDGSVDEFVAYVANKVNK